MEKSSKSIESLIERMIDYINSSYHLIRLKTIDTVSDIVSSLLSGAIVLVLIMLFFLFLNLGFAFWIGEILNSLFLGFFVVAGFYGLVLVIVSLFLVKPIKNSFSNFIIKRLLNKKNI
jgi:hypothetical protein